MKTVEHNKATETNRKSVSVLYHKISTNRLVKRRVDPLSIRGHLLIGYDHKRRALRSFDMGRVKDMEKSAFWKGFEKRAAEKHKDDANARAYGLMGAGLGTFAGGAASTGIISHVLNADSKLVAPALLAGLAAGGYLGHKLGRHVGAKYDDAKVKEASALYHAAELGGLGVLAAPSVAHLAGHKMKEGTQHKLELGGLGILAAPSLYEAGKGALKKLRALRK